MIYHEDATLTWLRSRPATDDRRIDIGDPYVERFWLPLIGPASVCLMRWVDRERIAAFPVADIGPRIGLNKSSGRHSPTWRTINRLITYGFIDHSQSVESSLFLWSGVRPLSKRGLDSLPHDVRIAERLWWDNNEGGVVPIFRGRTPLIGTETHDGR